MHFKTCEDFLQLFNKLLVICNSDSACNLQAFSLIQISPQNKPVISLSSMEMELRLKHNESFQEKDQALFIQIFWTSLPFLFAINFILVHDIGTNINTIINKSFNYVFVYYILLKSLIKYFFSFQAFFFSFFSFDLTFHKIPKIILGLSPHSF